MPAGLIAGVIADAVYTGVVVQPVLRNTLRPRRAGNALS